MLLTRSKLDNFYEMLQKVVDEIPRHDIIITGDINAKVGAKQSVKDG